MKKYILSFVLILSCCFITSAQLLWEINGKDLKKPSYVFGTHHLIRIQFLDSIPGLFKSFNNSDVVIGEMVMNNIDATQKMQQAALLPQGTTMADLLNEDDYILVDNELHSVIKLGLSQLAMLNPAFIRTMYEMELFCRKTGFQEDEQSDTYFQIVAEKKGKQIIGLETMDQQIEILFGNKDIEKEAELLVESIRNKDKTIEDMVKMTAMYKAGDIEELVKWAQDEDTSEGIEPEEYAVLVDNRNKEWVKMLPGYMQENPCFISVGALHLGGENGILNLLKSKGYKVTAVKERKKL